MRGWGVSLTFVRIWDLLLFLLFLQKHSKRTHTQNKTKNKLQHLANKKTKTYKNNSVVSALWRGPTNTTLPRDGRGHDVVQEPGPTSHTTPLQARLLHNVITGPAIGSEGSEGIFDMCFVCGVLVVFLFVRVYLCFCRFFCTCCCFCCVCENQQEPQTNNNLQEPTKPTRTC